jgi:predicted DsbA family dithiol-disulfide isomerase
MTPMPNQLPPEPLQIIAYSDYVCPWCYIGLQRIERLTREFPVVVEWRPFELHPETPTTGASLAGRLGSPERARAYRDNIIMLASESGLEMRMPRVVANSHLSLEAAEFAREHGGFEAFHRALFQAYFERSEISNRADPEGSPEAVGQRLPLKPSDEESRDIGDPDVLCEIARACGVDDQGLRQALADETYRAHIDDVTRAVREDEVVSTPTFIFQGDNGFTDGFRLTGGQDYAVFASVTSRILARRARNRT